MTAADYHKTVKAIEIANGGGVKDAGNGQYFVASNTDAEVFYSVKHEGHKWTCTCPQFKQRGHFCKHILAAYKVEDKARLVAQMAAGK